MEVKFVRLGSDPEFLFCTVKEWAHQLIPASQVITANKAAGLASFIGTDGHAATAELRPRPAHNIRLHLYDIAAAIDATDSFLRKSKKWSSQDVKMYAQPYVCKEPLGGHIHASMFVNDSLMAKVQQQYNRSYDRQWVAYNQNQPTAPITESLMTELNTHASAVGQLETVGMDLFAAVMHYLLLPFEKWVQPWQSRINRNSKYGGDMSNDNVRRVQTMRPNMPKYDTWAYLHYEYRAPSTWLIHPWYAYAYLALAKFTMVNWNVIYKIVKGGTKPLQIPGDGQPHNREYFKQFSDRMHALKRNGARVTRDMDDLDATLRLITEMRESWTNPFSTIDVTAWRKLL